MAYDLLLREGRINGMRMRNRLIAGPMERAMANRDGSLTRTYIDYLAERAAGGAALIVVEAAYVDPRGMGPTAFQVGCHGDHVIPGLRRAAEAVHAAGGKLGLELNFGGRTAEMPTSRRQPIAPSVVPCEVLDPVAIPREMGKADIEEIVSKYAAAAERAVGAGLDMLHLHGAHGYLLGAFLSPFTNKRTDEYGGSLEGRARLALQVLAAVREVVGADFPIGYRISADEYIDGGLTVTDTAEFAKLLADAGIDLIDVTGGIFESMSMAVQGPDAPRGGSVGNALSIKEAVGDRVPVSVAQRLNEPDLANDVRRQGLDFITLSRAFHADPAFARKLVEGRPDEIIPCIACFTCSNFLAESQPVRCAVNPATGLERMRRVSPARRSRRVAVVGGGPAGMQAARSLTLQGHSVVLYEKDDALGGQVRYSALVAPDFERLTEHLGGQLAKLAVDLRLGVEADVEILLRDEPDVLVLATGARGGLWPCEIEGNPRAFDLFGAFERPADDWEDRVAVIGGDAESCCLAIYLAGRGVEVHLTEPRREFAYDRGPANRGWLLQSLTDLPTIHLRPESTVERIGEGWVVIQKQGAHERLDDVGSVVVGGRVANNTLFEQVVESHPELEVYCIGDAVAPRGVYAASHEAADTAERISLRAVA